VPTERSSVPGVLPSVPTFTHEESLEPEENGAPEPLEHAMPDGELADAQLAVGRPLEPEPDDEADEEEFELEVEESIARSGAGPGDGAGFEDGSTGSEAAVRAPAHAEARPGMFARLIAFLQGSWRELQRVQWPDRRQVMQATGVVIGFVIVAAAFLGLADLVSQKVVTFILK
jgi:preprotein translocase SecE subunit